MSDPTTPAPEPTQPDGSVPPVAPPPAYAAPQPEVPTYAAPQPDPAAYAAPGYAAPQANPYAAPQAPYNPYAAAPAAKWNVLSIVTLVLGVLGFAIVPVITGHISLSQIKKTGEQGKVLAIIGLVLGYIGIAFWLIFGIIFIIAIAASVSSGVSPY